MEKVKITRLEVYQKFVEAKNNQYQKQYFANLYHLLSQLFNSYQLVKQLADQWDDSLENATYCSAISELIADLRLYKAFEAKYKLRDAPNLDFLLL